MTRFFLSVIMCVVLVACSGTSDLAKPIVPLGDFKLGAVVVRAADEIQKGPLSRPASDTEWEAAMETAFETRFQRFQGQKTYDIGVVVDGYVLAQVGLPVVASPKSVLIFRVIIVDRQSGTALTAEPHQLTVLETFNPGNVVSSGLANTREQQLADLSQKAARSTENWLRTLPEFSG